MEVLLYYYKPYRMIFTLVILIVCIMSSPEHDYSSNHGLPVHDTYELSRKLI